MKADNRFDMQKEEILRVFGIMHFNSCHRIFAGIVYRYSKKMFLPKQRIFHLKKCIPSYFNFLETFLIK